MQSQISIVFIEIVQGGIPSNEGCSDAEQGSGSDSNSSMVSLSEFSCTPTTNSLTDDEGGEREVQQAHSPDHIQMDVEIPPVQLVRYPIEVEVQPIPMPFPPTPELPEVSEPGPVVKPNSYRDIKDSLYFQENMVKKKQTKKLTKKEKESLLLAGKQPRQQIPATPL